MARAVQDVLEHDGVLLIEAGTGTGKTWAYLIPAALSGRRVLVSTGTRALQDQIMEKDLPALKRHLGIEIDAACVKGLSNYVCRRRFHELSSSADRASATTSAAAAFTSYRAVPTPCSHASRVRCLRSVTGLGRPILVTAPRSHRSPRKTRSGRVW
jgi:Rad3-related DNA helicase